MAHKPQSTTDRIATLSFADALARETEPCGYDRKKWIYVPDTYEEYRYLLGTVGTKPLVCIGINPSTAHPDHLDNTLKSVERIAYANGYDSFIMVNVYAQRATDPKDMEKYAISHSIGKTVRDFDMHWRGQAPVYRQSGRHGERSSKPDRIFSTAWRI